MEGQNEGGWMKGEGKQKGRTRRWTRQSQFVDSETCFKANWFVTIDFS